MIAWLKVIGPLVYGAIYVRGLSAGLAQAPFLLNVALTLVALALTPFAVRAVGNTQESAAS